MEVKIVYNGVLEKKQWLSYTSKGHSCVKFRLYLDGIDALSYLPFFQKTCLTLKY